MKDLNSRRDCSKNTNFFGKGGRVGATKKGRAKKKHPPKMRIIYQTRAIATVH